MLIYSCLIICIESFIIKDSINGNHINFLFNTSNNAGDDFNNIIEDKVDKSVECVEEVGGVLKSIKYGDNIDVYPLENTKINSKVPKLPPGEFKPRKSLGQNFITDLNLMNKMCDSLQHYSEDPGDGSQVIELGCGIGSLTQILYKKYKNMTGIEIDSRAVSQLSRTLPNLNIINNDVLQMDYKELSNRVGKKLWIIGNLPYYITSQILMCLLDYRKYIDRAVITSQLEVAERLVAPVGSKHYSMLSVLIQMFTKPKILFKLSNQVFYPKPKVQSACIKLDFNNTTVNTSVSSMNSVNSVNSVDSVNNVETEGGDDPGNKVMNMMLLREILRITFNKKRKKLKSSLKSLLSKYNVKLPENVLDLRPQNLSPENFIALTNHIYKHINSGNGDNSGNSGKLENLGKMENMENLKISEKTLNSLIMCKNNNNNFMNENFERIWRKSKHGPKLLISDMI